MRLGGFYMLMSYLRTIGSIKDGSGLKEILCEIYAEGSMNKIVNGHAFARAWEAYVWFKLLYQSSLFLNKI